MEVFVYHFQGLYEGTKAYRTEDRRILLFRPAQNAMRMRMGAERMCMPSPSIDQFVNAVKQIALVNKRWVILLLKTMTILHTEVGFIIIL